MRRTKTTYFATVMSTATKAITSIFLTGCICTTLHAITVINDTLSQSGGISEASPTTTSSQLNYQICNSSNSDQQALLKINIIGNGANQVPAGSTITSAMLNLRAEVGGDGQLFRVGTVWDSTPTWNELGDVPAFFPAIGVGLNTGQGMPFDVTSHVQLWANGTSNQGWVIKGSVDDCQAARIYNGSASSGNRPRLTVIYVPPDTTGPRVTHVYIGSNISTHADYDVPSGSGIQIKTVPVAKINQIFVKFDENVSASTVNASAFSLVSANTGTSYPPSGGVGYDPSTFTATYQLASGIDSPDQLIFTVFNSVTDIAGNALDGEWTNPTSVTSTGTSSFPSGNGTPGTPVGGFKFYFTVLPADYNGNNAIDAADYVVWRNNNGTMSGAGQANGDGDGDGDVDNNDYSVWNSEYGTDFTTW